MRHAPNPDHELRLILETASTKMLAAVGIRPYGGDTIKKVTMAEEEKFTIGAEVRCSDGVCGQVIRVVVDPVARAVTHLVIEPKHRQGLGRLVPLDLVDDSTGEARLTCTLAEFEQLDWAEETQFLPGSGGHADYTAGQALSHPYFGLGNVIGDVPQPVTYDTVPLHEVAVRRGEQVHATDGSIGSVQGLVIDPRNHQVTHVLLQEGHLWGRRQVAIPIGAVSRVDGGIHLNITKQEVEDLPAVVVDHPTN
ncbi:MAG: PRC-barrel domain-containing protein [Acidimicrobiales bacterium]